MALDRIGIAASGFAQTLEISRNICHCHKLLLMQHFIWEFQLPEDSRYLSAPRGGEGCRLVSVLHLALHSIRGAAQNGSQQSEKQSPKHKQNEHIQILELGFVVPGEQTLLQHWIHTELKLLAQIWADLHSQTHPEGWESLIGVSSLTEICSYRNKNWAHVQNPSPVVGKNEGKVLCRGEI